MKLGGMDSTLPHLEELTGTLIGLLMDSRRYDAATLRIIHPRGLPTYSSITIMHMEINTVATERGTGLTVQIGGDIQSNSQIPRSCAASLKD